jgi:putative transposase
VIPLFAEPSDIRKVIYTTNATPVGQYDASASVTRNHRIFPSDEAVYKVVYLAMRNMAREVDDAHSCLETSAGSLCSGIHGALP